MSPRGSIESMPATAHRLLGYAVWRSARRRPMSSAGYRLLGIVVWQGGTWYLRRRLASRRMALLGVSVTAALLLGVGLWIARRAGD